MRMKMFVSARVRKANFVMKIGTGLNTQDGNLAPASGTVSSAARNERLREGMMDKEICEHMECINYDERGVGNCLHVPPDECGIKRQLATLTTKLDRYKRALELACEMAGEYNGCEMAGEYNDNNRDDDERSKCDHCAFADAEMAKNCLIDHFLTQADNNKGGE
jgi:hypothetical protein